MTAEAKSAGRIESALTRLFLRSATLSEVRVLDEQFRLVTLSGEALKGVNWTPGQKVQVALGGWTSRTYTPINWDAEKGSTQLLVYLHGEAPGAAWGRAIQGGDACSFLGPRDSLDLNALERSALLFGDETSFGLACALRATAQGATDVQLLFEVTSKAAAEGVLKQLGLHGAQVVERKADDSHLSEVEHNATQLLQTRVIKGCALSGKAPSIQRINKFLRAQGLTSRQIKTRAYWAPGKVGLD